MIHLQALLESHLHLPPAAVSVSLQETCDHPHFPDEETQAWKGELTSQGHISSHTSLQGSLGNGTLNHSSFTITDVKQIRISYDWSVTG